MAELGVTPVAFDEVASAYDETFSQTPLAKMLRPRVWRRLAQCFRPGQRVLELACGTGEDALWLARRGVEIVATDASAEMLRIVNSKVAAAKLANKVVTAQLSLQDLGQQPDTIPDPDQVFSGRSSTAGRGSFDGAFSNFGGLNTIGDWDASARALGRIVRPGGRLVLVVMGPFCPWEISWKLAHGRPRQAFRRFRGPVEATVGQSTIPIWYPSAGRLQRAFRSWFRHLQTESLGLFLPPTYLNHLVERWPGLFQRLAALERRTANLGRGWGDHYLTILERKPVID